MSESLVVSEIFKSIQGESSHAGLPCTMIRLAGCNLNCTWCDTNFARDGRAGETMSIDAILDGVADLGCQRVEVTGGEPLSQPATADLLRRLCLDGYTTLLETNGTVDLQPVDARVLRIVDIKCPSSGHADATRWENLSLLTSGDEVKFVLADRDDYDYAMRVLMERGLPDMVRVIFSPVAERLDPARLAGWILEDGLDVRLGLQLHRIIWPDRERGV
ncbi:MAG: radical SAM protein [Planctomycetes bacterium]|jgi:7-carboxy-7-deazaguanine synthase|nr:radical SAM protein [Phycisphaerae bacterium]NBB96472.1 radical SAM protein [Planctomycetota bacterium]